MTDNEIIVRAVQDARRVLAERCDPQGLTERDALRLLFQILDNDRVVTALQRLDFRNTFEVVSIRPG